MKLRQIIETVRLENEQDIEELFQVLISRRTYIDKGVDNLILRKIEDDALKAYYLDRREKVKKEIENLPVVAKPKSRLRGKSKKQLSNDPLSKMRRQKMYEAYTIFRPDEKYEYGLSDW